MITAVCCFMFICASCRNYNVKFDVIEEKSSLINPVDESNVNEIQSDDELKIYKGYNEMINDLNSRGFIVNNDSFFEKYCDDFFENKSLVLLYSNDSTAGIKYTFESMYEYNQCRLYKNGKFDMLHGQDETILPCLAMGGAQGGIGGTTNYNGKELVGIIEAWEAGDIETARERQNFSQEVINVICHFRGNIVGGKRIMKLIGLDLGKNRTPFQNMTDEEEAQMKAELEAIHFFDRCNKF